MRLLAKEWVIFIVLAVILGAAWYHFSYAQLSFFDYKVNKTEALRTAERFLRERGVDESEYRRAIIFSEDTWADRYLQQTLGFKNEEEFLKEHDYELFYWLVRFFKEGEKEEYVIGISPRSAQILYFSHQIEDTEARETKERTVARQFAKAFLADSFGVDFSAYDFHEEKALRKDNRIDYNFSWEKKGVYIPWKQKDESGGAKLIIGATVSGDEIKAFYKNNLDIPEKFERYVRGQQILGRAIHGFFRLVFFLWLGWSIFFIVRRRGDMFIYRSWRWMILIGGFLLVLSVAYACNDFQSLLFSYVTSSSFISYFGLYFVTVTINYAFASIAVVTPGAAGESLRGEVFPQKKLSSLFHYITTTLWSRSVARSIMLGYVLAVIFLGMQALLFAYGQKYWGVWVERMRLTSITTASVPFLTAFIIGCRASLSEEIMYRIFGIYWAKKYFKNTVFAVCFAAVVWGFSHTQYPVFPVWFRGIEVSAMGVVYGFILLRYGIIPLIVAHYLFDVFWGVSGFLLGDTSPYLFYSSVFILAVPFIFAAVAFLLDREERERTIETLLTPMQHYNSAIVRHYLQQKRQEGVSADDMRRELLAHGWDRVVVEYAVNEIFGKAENY